MRAPASQINRNVIAVAHRRTDFHSTTKRGEVERLNRTHLVTIAVGVVMLTVSWIYVVPLLLDLNDRSGQAAAFGWIALVGATGIVGWVMFRPPGPLPEDEGPRRKPRRGLRRARQRKR